jgi:hypothetical protein
MGSQLTPSTSASSMIGIGIPSMSNFVPPSDRSNISFYGFAVLEADSGF